MCADFLHLRNLLFGFVVSILIKLIIQIVPGTQSEKIMQLRSCLNISALLCLAEFCIYKQNFVSSKHTISKGKSQGRCSKAVTGLPKPTDLYHQTKVTDFLLKNKVDFIDFVFICIPNSVYKYDRRA